MGVGGLGGEGGLGGWGLKLQLKNFIAVLGSTRDKLKIKSSLYREACLKVTKFLDSCFQHILPTAGQR